LRVVAAERHAKSLKSSRRTPNRCRVLQGQMAKVELRHYLKEANTNMVNLSLAEALSGQRTLDQPGVPPEKAVRLTEGEALSEAVIDERENQVY
jgi:hypothetical protein